MLKYLCIVLTSSSLVLAVGPNLCRADIMWEETYVGDGTTITGADVEGLASATLTMRFTTDSGPTYVEVFALPATVASTATVTISGSALGLNDDTFTIATFGGSSGKVAAFPTACSACALDAVNAGSLFFGPLTNGSYLEFPTASYSGGTSTPAVHDQIGEGAYGVVFLGRLSAPTTYNASGTVNWSQSHSNSSTLSVTAAIPEPSTAMLVGCALWFPSVLRNRSAMFQRRH